MAKKKTPFLDFYNNTIKRGRMVERSDTTGSGGLCNTSIGKEKMLYIFFPDADEKCDYKISHSFWGSEIDTYRGNEVKCMYEFTPLRQTIVLFCAAINNEL